MKENETLIKLLKEIIEDEPISSEIYDFHGIKEPKRLIKFNFSDSVHRAIQISDKYSFYSFYTEIPTDDDHEISYIEFKNEDNFIIITIDNEQREINWDSNNKSLDCNYNYAQSLLDLLLIQLLHYKYHSSENQLNDNDTINESYNHGTIYKPIYEYSKKNTFSTNVELFKNVQINNCYYIEHYYSGNLLKIDYIHITKNKGSLSFSIHIDPNGNYITYIDSITLDESISYVYLSTGRLLNLILLKII